ncbi:MAG: hypothetical protein AAF485_15515 [Chloroflexota bacterium]
MLALADFESEGLATLEDVEQRWSAALGGLPVLIVESVAQARAALLASAELSPGEPVAVPANASRPLVEAIKRARVKPYFVNLDVDLTLHVASPSVQLAWGHSLVGLTPLVNFDGPVWHDCADTLPSPAMPLAEVSLYGLHLALDEQSAGALLVFRKAELAKRVSTQLSRRNVDANRALAQFRWWESVVGRQQMALNQVKAGLKEAAGLSILSAMPGGLAHGVLVRIPDDIDVATFYAYVKAENTPVQWLPEVRPLHYAAAATGQTTAANLARYLLVPVGPDYSEEEIDQAILGIAKAADFLGVRWYTDPAWAVKYAQMMVEWYGTDHDAYRPIFEMSNV